MFIKQKYYEKIIKKPPSASIDIAIVVELNRFLLMLKKNEPAKDQLWFPRGRIHCCERLL